MNINPNTTSLDFSIRGLYLNIYVLFTTVTMKMFDLPLDAQQYWENVTFSVTFGIKHVKLNRFFKTNRIKMEITKPVDYFWAKVESESGTSIPVHIKNTFT